MQRLALAPQRRVLTPRVKETGTPIDFTHAREISLQSFVFQDAIFGVYAYQSYPVTVDAATRNAFLNGNLTDLINEAEAQRMPIQYILIAWNETLQGDKYYITDLVVGVVSKVSYPLNTSPSYLIDAFKKIGWYNNMISKMPMPWQSWELLKATTAEVFNRWNWDAISKTYRMLFYKTDPVPQPNINEVQSHFVNDGQIATALGGFVQLMLSKGYTVTIHGYKAYAAIEFVGIEIPWGSDWRFALYKTHTRLSVDFTSSPECFFTESPIVITAAAAWAIAKCISLIILAIGVGAGVFFALVNLTTTEESYEKWGWVQNPETGEWEWKPIETGTKKGAPDWWMWVLIGGIIIATIIVVPPIIKSLRGKRE